MLLVFCLAEGFSFFYCGFFTKLLVTSWAFDTQRGEQRVLWGQTEGKNSLERPMRIWEDNTTM